MKKYNTPNAQILVIETSEDVLSLSVETMYKGLGSNNINSVWEW